MADSLELTQEDGGESPRPTLAICTPSYDGRVSCYYTESLMGSVFDLERAGIKTRLIWLTQCSLLPRARDQLVASFMESGCTHMLFVDSDISWPRSAIGKLLAYDQPLIGIAGLRRGGDRTPCIRPLDEKTNTIQYLGEDRKIARVGALGTGFMMIRRDVIERMQIAFPNLKKECKDMSEAVQEHYYALFNLDVGESEDFSFCRRWRLLGGEILVDTTVSLRHEGRITYAGALNEFLNENAQRVAGEQAEAAD